MNNLLESNPNHWQAAEKYVMEIAKLAVIIQRGTPQINWPASDRDAAGCDPMPLMAAMLACQQHLHQTMVDPSEKTIDLLAGQERFIFRCPRGLHVARAADILYLLSEGNYTSLVLAGNEKVIVTGTLREFDRELNKRYFCRIHKSHIINTLHVESYVYKRVGTVRMSNGVVLAVSARRLSSFIDAIESTASVVGGGDATLLGPGVG